MAEFNYGVTKVHGFVSTGYESLTSNFEFITISTAVDVFEKQPPEAGGNRRSFSSCLDGVIGLGGDNER